MEENIRRRNDEMDNDGDKQAVALPDGVIPCAIWDLDDNPVRLPSIPHLPALTNQTEDEKPTQLVKIAGLDGHIIGLTNKGHVLKYSALDNALTSPRGRWQYVG